MHRNTETEEANHLFRSTEDDKVIKFDDAPLDLNIPVIHTQRQ
jgi:hypothetical protein